MPKFDSWQGEVDDEGRAITKRDRVSDRIDSEAPTCVLCDAQGRNIVNGLCAACTSHKCPQCNLDSTKDEQPNNLYPKISKRLGYVWVKCVAKDINTKGCGHTYLVKVK